MVSRKQYEGKRGGRQNDMRSQKQVVADPNGPFPTEFGLTRERVRQIKDKAINKLRATSRSKLLKTYLGS